MEIKASPFAKNIYKQIKAAGSDGFNPVRAKFKGIEKALAELNEYIIVLSEDTVLLKSVAGDCIAGILKGKKSGDEIDLKEAKSKSGLSRRVLIPLLEYMDRQGLTVRTDSTRLIR